METKISNDSTAVIYRRGPSGTEFLVLKRFDPEKGVEHVRLLKGGIKKAETADGAIIREISEEVGLSNVRIVSALGNYEYETEFKGVRVVHKVSSFLVEVPEENSAVKVDSSEEGGFVINGAEWLGCAEAAAKLSFLVEQNLAREAISKIP